MVHFHLKFWPTVLPTPHIILKYYSLRSKMIVGLPLRNLLQDGRGFRCNIMNYRPLHILPRINNPTIILERREYILDLLNREDHNLRGSYTV